MPSLKERVENNVVVWLLGMLLAGFLAGIGTYKGILEIANLTVVAKPELENLKSKSGSTLQAQKQIVSLSPGYSVIIPKVNLVAKLDADENLNRKTKATRIWFLYPKNELATITEENRTDKDIVSAMEVWIEPNKFVPLSLGGMGSFEVKVVDHQFNPEHDYVQRVTLEIKKL